MPKETPADKDNPMAGMAKAMVSMLAGNLKLEFRPGDRFVLTMMVPVEGTVTRTGNKLVLKPEKVMGMTPEEAAKMSNKGPMPMDMKEPLNAEVSEDGKTIRVLPGKGQSEGAMVFHRYEKKAVKSTVTAEEEKFVGEYRAEVIPPKDQSSPEKQKAAQMLEHMKDAFSLELRADNTYTMNMIMALEGKWQLAGGKVKLSMEDLGGMASAMGAAPGKTKSTMPDTLTPGPDGSLTLDAPASDRDKGGLIFHKK
jgi:hypothetical protein